LLRVHDLRLVFDDVLVNPWSAAHDGRFDPLQARRLTVARATLAAADLQRFLGQVKGLGRTSLVLGEGYADVSFEVLGPEIVARESPEAKKARARKILTRLERAYPDAKIALNFTTPLELLVATILSAQCTDERVNMVTPALFRAYRAAPDYARASPAALEKLI